MKPWYRPGPGWYEIPDDPPEAEDAETDFDEPWEPFLSDEVLDREALEAENRWQERLERMGESR